MSSNGQFEEEDSDIVKLLPDTSEYERTGWINIGVHSVKLQLTADGNLIIQSFARSNEEKTLAEVVVKRDTAVAAGGIDDDDDRRDSVSACTCTDCGAEVESIIGCPNGAEVCSDCFNSARH